MASGRESTLASRWAVLALLCFARVSMGFNFQSVAAVAPFLTAEMGITYAQVGMLLGLWQFPGVFVSLPGAFLGTRRGDKLVLLLALALLTAGALLLGVSSSFRTALGARLLSGIGGVLLSVQLTKVVTDWFAGRELGTALGFLMSMWPLGLALALATLGSVATVVSWQAAVYMTAAYSGFALVLVGALYRDPPRPIRSGRPELALWTLSRRELTFMMVSGICWMFLNTGFIVFMSFAPTVLLDRGLSLAQAGFLVSWASLIPIASLPMGGYLIDRTRRPNLFLVLGAVATALTVFAFALTTQAQLWIVLFGIAFAAPTPAVIALPSEVLRAESRSVGFGAFNTVYYVGMAMIPPVAGHLLDVTGSVASPMCLSGLLWLMILPPLLVFRLLQKHWGQIAEEGTPLAARE